MKTNTVVRSAICALAMTCAPALADDPGLEPNAGLSGEGVGLAIAAGGTGAVGETGTGTISFSIDGPVQQAVLYWGGRGTLPADDVLLVDGAPVSGDLIGSEINSVDTAYVYRADLTGYVQGNFTAPGVLSLEVEDPTPGHDFGGLRGASLVVIYTDESDTQAWSIQLFDGADFAYGPALPDPSGYTDPVDFEYAASDSDRWAELLVIAADGTEPRPDRIDISDNAPVSDELNGSDGGEWDTDFFDVFIPMGADTTTVELVSPPEAGWIADSLLWAVGALRVPIDQGECLGLLIIDEDTIDEDISTIIQAANDCNELPDVLVNEDHPTHFGNPPLHWNEFCPGGEYWLPAGQTQDEGLFAPGPGSGLDLDAFIAGTIPENDLDEIPDINPIGDPEIQQFPGRSFVAVVYDSDISINVEFPDGDDGDPLYIANLKGERLGLFFFTVLEVRAPGNLPETGSSSSLWEFKVRVDPVPQDYCWEFFDEGSVGNEGGTPAPCPGDLTADGLIDVFDLIQLLGMWGPCSGSGCAAGDLNADDNIDVIDLLQMLSLWGPC